MADNTTTNKKRRVEKQQDGPQEQQGSSLTSLQQEITELRQQNQGLKTLLCNVLKKSNEFKWEEVPDEWKNDVDIIAAAVAGGVLDWWVLSPERKYEPRVVAALTGQEVTQDPVNPGNVALVALKKKNDDDQRFYWDRYLPKEMWKNHQELALFGVINKFVKADECPCLVDRSFMKRAVENKSIIFWDDLPTPLKNDIDFARSIEKVPSELIAFKIIEHFPELRADPSLWKMIVDPTENPIENGWDVSVIMGRICP